MLLERSEMPGSPKSVIEHLEARQLFASIGLSHHILNVAGAGSANTITVGLSPDQQSVVATIAYQNAKGPQQIVQSFAVGDIHEVFIRGGPHGDLITVDQTNGSFVIPTKIVAGGGNDTVFGGDEPDNISGGQGADYIDAGQGANQVTGEGGADTLIGGDGGNLLMGGAGNDSLVGGAGADTLFGQNGSDTLIGNAGNDILRGGLGRDSEVAGDGNDMLFDINGVNTLLGGAGNNTFAVISINGNPDNDYTANKDLLKRIAPPSTDSGLLGDILKGVLFPYY
jgi:Ca2+-binding RTX toxin-like protein